jgi:hypothetical protein
VKKLLDLVKKAVKVGKVAINPIKVGKSFINLWLLHIFTVFANYYRIFFTNLPVFTDLPTPYLMTLP